MITQTYNLNLIPDKVPVSVDCSQYDSLSRTIVFNIYDGTVLKDLTGATATVRGTKQDNTGFEYSCTVNGSTVSFDIQDQMTIFSGKVPCEIRLVNNGILGSCNFILNVEPTPLDPNVTISETDLPLLEEAEQNAIRAEQAADEAESLLSTVVKSVNNTFPDASGNVTVQTSSPLSAGTGIDISNDIVTNTGLNANLRTYRDTDLNTITTGGTYYVQASSTSVASSCNYPNGTNAILIVVNTTGTTNCKQFYFRIGTTDSNDHNWFARSISNGVATVGTWYRIYNENCTNFGSCLILTSSSFSSLPQTITNSNITSSHVVLNSVLSNPSAQTGDWTVTTSDGSLSISGSISGSTTVTLYLMRGV